MSSTIVSIADSAALSTAAEPTDVALLISIANDNRAAFGTLFRRHARVAYAAAYGVVRRREDAEESVQDAFVTLWQKRRQVTVASDSLIPWIVAASRNYARNRARGAMRARTELLDAHPEKASDFLAEESSVAAELGERLESALAALSPLDREIVRLCLVDEIGYEKAADQLGITHSSVRNRLSRSRKALRTELHDLNEGNHS